MLRPTPRILSALLVLSAAACANSTAPTPTHPQLTSPAAGASFDDIIQTDTTCRSGYNVGQAKTC